MKLPQNLLMFLFFFHNFMKDKQKFVSFGPNLVSQHLVLVCHSIQIQNARAPRVPPSSKILAVSKKIAKNDIYVTWKGTSFVVLYVIIYCELYLGICKVLGAISILMTFEKIYNRCFAAYSYVRFVQAEFWFLDIVSFFHMQKSSTQNIIFGDERIRKYICIII